MKFQYETEDTFENISQNQNYRDIHLYSKNPEDGNLTIQSIHSAILGTTPNALHGRINFKNINHFMASLGELHLILDEEIGMQDIFMFLNLLHGHKVAIEERKARDNIKFLTDLFGLNVDFIDENANLPTECIQEVEINDKNTTNDITNINKKPRKLKRTKKPSKRKKPDSCYEIQYNATTTIRKPLKRRKIEKSKKQHRENRESLKLAKKRLFPKKNKEVFDYFEVGGEMIHKDMLGYGCPYCEAFMVKATVVKAKYDVGTHIVNQHPNVHESEIQDVVESIPYQFANMPKEGHRLLRFYRERTISEIKVNTPADYKNKKIYKKKRQVFEYFKVDGETIHKDYLGYGCPYCDVCYKLNDNARHKLQDHIVSHHQEVDVNEIGKTIRSIPSKVKNLPKEGSHLLRLYKERIRTEPKFNCHICEQKFALLPQLKGHVEEIHNGEGIERLENNDWKPYKCEFCGKQFADPSRYKYHIRDKHSIETWICHECDKNLPTERLLGIHHLSEHEKKTYQEKYCDLCGKVFNQRSKVMSHIFTTHLEEKIFKCEKCARTFRNRALMETHLNNVHSSFKEENEADNFVQRMQEVNKILSFAAL